MRKILSVVWLRWEETFLIDLAGRRDNDTKLDIEDLESPAVAQTTGIAYLISYDHISIKST